MTTSQITTPVTIFECKPWSNDGQSIKPIPGTWTLPPFAEHVNAPLAKIVAIMSCPHCGTAALLTKDMVELDVVAHVGRMSLFRCAKCPFACQPVFRDWDKRKLYCVAYEKLHGDTLVPLTEYFHAIDRKDAKNQFRAGHMGEPIHIVGIAPVVGYFVDDNKGESLSV